MVAYTFYEIDNRVRRYAETLVKRGDVVDAIALRREGQPYFEILSGVHVYRIQKREIDERRPFSYLIKLLLFFWRSAWALAIRHWRNPYDVIHVHSVPDFEVFATFIPRLLGARVILDIHDIVPEFYASKFHITNKSPVFFLLVMIERVSIAYSHHVIISNHLWYTTLTSRSVRPGKCTPIINYPDLSIFSRSVAPPSRRQHFVMCYPGTLNEHQGVDLAIEAVMSLREAIPTLRLLILGKGPERNRLAAMVKQNGLEDRVSILGVVPINEVAAIMSNVDLGVVPKRGNAFGNEAFSTKIMEFMAMGVPVVVSKTRIDQHYFNDDLVQFFEPDSTADLAAQVLRLSRDVARRDSLSSHGLAFIRQNNWEMKKAEYLNIIDGLVAGHSRRWWRRRRADGAVEIQ